MAEAKTSGRRILAKVRLQRALSMRLAGATYEQIAAAPISDTDRRPLYSSRQRAQEAVDGHLQRMAREAAGTGDELRALEMARLEALHLAMWPATRPSRPVKCEVCQATMYREVDLAAVDRVLKVMERRSKYQGLDAADANEERAVAVLEQQVAMTQGVLVEAMGRAGLTPEVQREVMQHAADLFREVEAAEE